MNDLIRNSIRTALCGAAAVAASVSWAQAPEPPTSTSSATTPTATEAPAVTDSTTPPSQATTPNTTASAESSVALDDQKIDQFADAYVAVQKIQTSAASELDSTAGDPAKQQQAQAKVENEMIAAVEKTGLKLEEFNGIVQTMTADADLRARVVAKIRERMGG